MILMRSSIKKGCACKAFHISNVVNRELFMSKLDVVYPAIISASIDLSGKVFEE